MPKILFLAKWEDFWQNFWHIFGSGMCLLKENHQNCFLSAKNIIFGRIEWIFGIWGMLLADILSYESLEKPRNKGFVGKYGKCQKFYFWQNWKKFLALLGVFLALWVLNVSSMSCSFPLFLHPTACTAFPEASVKAFP